MAIMTMGRQEQRARQRGLWIARTKPAVGLGCPLYQLPRELPAAGKSDAFVEARYVEFHGGKYGCPSLALASIFGLCRSNVLRASRPSAGSSVRLAEFAARAAELLPGRYVKEEHPWSLCEVGAYL